MVLGMIHLNLCGLKMINFVVNIKMALITEGV